MPADNSPFPPGSRLVAYCRDSGGRDQDLSIPQQEQKIGEWCKTHGYALVRVFKDSARSGTTTAGREQFIEMFRYLSGGVEVVGVVLWEYARLSRSWDDSMFYLADLRRQGYAVFSLSDQVPEGLEGRLMESIISWKNARYSADLSANVRRGKAYVVAALKGWPHADVPPGYKKEYFQAGTRRDGSPHMVARLVPDPQKAPLIQEAFRLRAQGVSYSGIRKALPLVRRNSSLAPLLHNPIYIGIYDYGDLRIEDYCSPVVDLEIWQRAQQVNEVARTRSGWYHSRRINSPFLLSGIALCLYCGTPLDGLHTKPKKHLGHYSYYICPNRPYRYTSDSYCSAPGIRKELLEERVKSALVDLLDQPQVLLDLQSELERKAARRSDSRQEAQRLTQADLDDILKRISRVTEAIQAAGHSEALIADLASLEARREELRLSLEKLTSPSVEANKPTDLLSLARDMRAALSAASGKEQQQLFRLSLVSVRAGMEEAVLAGEVEYRIGNIEGVLSL